MRQFGQLVEIEQGVWIDPNSIAFIELSGDNNKWIIHTDSNNKYPIESTPKGISLLLENLKLKFLEFNVSLFVVTKAIQGLHIEKLSGENSLFGISVYFNNSRLNRGVTVLEHRIPHELAIL